MISSFNRLALKSLNNRPRFLSNLVPLKQYAQDRIVEKETYFSNTNYAMKVSEERVACTLNGFNRNTTYNDLLRVLGPIPAHNLDYIVSNSDLLPTGVYLFSVPNENFYRKLQDRIENEFKGKYRLYRRKEFNIMAGNSYASDYHLDNKCVILIADGRSVRLTAILDEVLNRKLENFKSYEVIIQTHFKFVCILRFVSTEEASRAAFELNYNNRSRKTRVQAVVAKAL